jgi:hypothetical protein
VLEKIQAMEDSPVPLKDVTDADDYSSREENLIA